MNTTSLPQDVSPADRFYPLELGNQWTYRISGDVWNAGETAIFEVVDVLGQLGSREFVITQTQGDDIKPLVLIESREGLSEEGTDIYLLKLPLNKGHRWAGALYESRDKLFAFQVLDTDQTVHAGEHIFAGCLVIQMTDEARERTEQVTYAPGIGPVLYASGGGPAAIKSALTIESWNIQEVA